MSIGGATITEPVVLDLGVADAAPVELDLASPDSVTVDTTTPAPVSLNAPTMPPLALDLTGAPPAVMLDLTDPAGDEVTINLSPHPAVVLTARAGATVVLDLGQLPPVELDVLPGVPGPPGPPGPPGADGVGSFYTHNQAAAAAVWTVVHTIPYMPAVTVVDSAGTVLYADVVYVDAQTVEITHSWPTAGYAYLS